MQHIGTRKSKPDGRFVYLTKSPHSAKLVGNFGRMLDRGGYSWRSFPSGYMTSFTELLFHTSMAKCSA